jgi:hypothetical protein
MDRAFRESVKIASILSNDAKSDALIVAKAAFHSEVVWARGRRKTRDDFAFVTRLRWAEQWIEIGLLSSSVGGKSSQSFRRALDMVEEARQVFTGTTAPGCAPPTTELPPVIRDST